MRPAQPGHRRDFDDHPFLNHKVHTVAAIETNAFVDQRQRKVPRETHLSFGQRLGEASLVGGFERARTNGPVNFDCASNDDANKRISDRRHTLSSASAAPQSQVTSPSLRRCEFKNAATAERSRVSLIEEL